jgi:hypothetical protein
MAATRQLKGTDPKAAKPSKPKILIFGKPGAGKTWASIDFPSVYYIDTEGGANLEHYTDKLKKAGGAYLGPADGANSFETVIEEVITLATTEHQYRTLVIDSYSKLFNTQVDINFEAMQRAGREMDKTFGAEKKPAIAYTRRLVRWFEKLDMNVILICHERALWKDSKEVGQTYDGWDKLEYELHLALQIVKQGASRKARITKSRLAEFPDGESFDWSYENFAQKYGRDVIEADATAVKLATPEQLKQIESLITVLKVDEELVAKWMDKAGVEKFPEMDTDTIQKCIGFLEAKIPKASAAA